MGDRSFDWLDVPALVRAAPRIWEYPMVDRDPLPNCGTGRVNLLGDAAHPMYPFGSNGGTQAIIDGRVLAWELAGADDPVAGLAAYEDARRERMNALVLSNRQGGPEQVLQLVEQRAPNGFTRIEDVMTNDELDSIANAVPKDCRVRGRGAQHSTIMGSRQTGLTASRGLSRNRRGIARESFVGLVWWEGPLVDPVRRPHDLQMIAETV
ncbi:MAG: FAD-dependent monooxygenase [Pseudonocardiaceae bacterium]